MPRDPEKRRASQAAYQRRRYATDPEYRERQKAHARRQRSGRTPEETAEIRAKERARYHEDPVRNAEVKERASKAGDALLVKRQEVIVAYGGVCECCGTDFYPHLCIDHIGGGGTQERASGVRSNHLIAKLWKAGFPEGYRVLCWNCNWAAHVFDGRCPCQDG